MSQNIELFAILNLFKIENEKTHEIGYTLLKSKFESIRKMDHEQQQKLFQELSDYFKSNDNVPGNVCSDLCQLFHDINNEEKMSQLEVQVKTLKEHIFEYQARIAQLEAIKDQLTELCVNHIYIPRKCKYY